MVVQEERELQPGWQGGGGVRGVRMGGLTTSLYVLEYTDEAVTIFRCSHNKFDSKMTQKSERTWRLYWDNSRNGWRQRGE